MSFPIIEKAERQAFLCFAGLAIPHQPSLADGVYGPIKSEKVLKFNRKAMREMVKPKSVKADPRLLGGEDKMIIKVGKPGSPERKQAMAEQYAAILYTGAEVSIFRD